MSLGCMKFTCIGVGTEKPFLVIAFSKFALRPIAWNPPPFLTLRPLRFEAFRFEAACVSAMNAASSDSLSTSNMPSVSCIRALRSGCWMGASSSETDVWALSKSD